MGTLLALLIFPACLCAQQQANTSSDQSTTRLRLEIVLSEYDGSKEVGNLPYSLFLESTPQGRGQPRSVRMGLKVPIATGGGQNGATTPIVTTQYQYENVGTDIDAWAKTVGDGLYDLDVNVDRSSVYPANQGTESDRIPRVGGLPVVRSFRSSFNLALRDGQTTQGPSATDPFNGHVLKVSITLHVVK
ncbi:MAG TPA: hypothetical protein VKB26_06975 [Candidatus Acidoferrales bacterium]|nr:hypothetical protein [Candidatus Acidoferrales bacterium]